MSFNNFLSGPWPKIDVNSKAYLDGERLAQETIEEIRKELSPIIAMGQVWQKRAHSKTSVNAPRIRVVGGSGTETVEMGPINFKNGYGFKDGFTKFMRKSTLIRDWELLL